MRSQQGEEEQGNITSYKECEKRYILSKWGAVGGGGGVWTTTTRVPGYKFKI